MPGRTRGGRRTPSAALLLVLMLAMLVAARLLREEGASPAEVIRQRRPHAVERVIDGDTLLLAGGQRVRLIGVDTPETKHPDRPVEPLRREAAAFVRSQIGASEVRLEFDRQRLDRYQRLLAYVWLPDGRLLNAELIRAGFSAAETGYPYRQDMQRQFLEAETQARAAGVGIWDTQATNAR